MKVHVLIKNKTGPIILWGMYPHRENELEKTKAAIVEKIGKSSYTLIAFEVLDWKGEFSPWKSPILDESFSGGVNKTLDYLVNELVPILKNQYGPNREIYLMGYSLAGLFALWSMYQTDLFAGALSCSGSLWYPEFISYVKKSIPLKNRKIYISLGGKEANTKNKLMATIADCTKEMVDILKIDNIVKYEMNSGGHFADAGKRLAKAVEWIVDYSNKNN